MGRSKDDQASKEDSFVALLQRIQRQYNAGSGGNVVSSNRPAVVISRPPDEAAYALGRGLAVSFLQFSVQDKEVNGNKEDSREMATRVVSKGIQEKTLVALADRRLNPSVCQGFFDFLLQNCRDAIAGIGKDDKSNNDTAFFINMDAWLPAWILYTEQRALSEQEEFERAHDCDDDWLALCLDPLSCMICTYAQFVRLKIIQESMKHSLDNIVEGQEPTPISLHQYLDPRSLSHPSSFIGMVAKTYIRLQTQAGRLSMLREFTKNAFIEMPKGMSSMADVPIYKLLLTPLMATAVLSASATTPSLDLKSTSMIEAIFYMEGVWKEAYLVLLDEESRDDSTNSDPSNGKATAVPDNTFPRKMKLLQWLTDTLNLFLISVPSRPSQSKIACKELAHRWLVTVLDLGTVLAQQWTEAFEDSTESIDSDPTITRVAEWFEEMISSSLLRMFALIPSYRMPLEQLWHPLKNLMAILTATKPLSLFATFKLAIIAVSQPNVKDVAEILNLLTISIESATIDSAESRKRQQKLHPTSFAILRGLGSVFLRDKSGALGTANLLEMLSRTKRLKAAEITSNAEESQIHQDASKQPKYLSNVIQLLEKDQIYAEAVVDILSNIKHDDLATNSAIQQSASFVFGVGLLDGPRRRASAYGFFRSLLHKHPHIGVSLLPVMVDSINATAIRGEGDCMMDHISFLCENLVRDTQCAREIWNLLGIELMRDNIPAEVRSSLIRMFPRICSSNKKLYKRVIESMGRTLLSCSNDESLAGSIDNWKGELQVRISIAATTAELAKEDLIRDPTDVIGWIQGFIADAGWVRKVSTRDRRSALGRAALVHYSVLALHYLVLAQELDYKLVLVVLGKRLCSVHDIQEVSKLPPLVLESLIQLLGDGELQDAGSDEERNNKTGPPPHAVKSVDTLINLWYSDALRLVPHMESKSRITILRCRENIFVSLTNYSVEALGLDDETVKAAAATAPASNDETKPKSSNSERYNLLKSLVEDGVVMIPASISILDSNAFISFASKLFKVEEESLGSSLWQKKGKASRASRKKVYGQGFPMPIRAGIFGSLPQSATIVETYNGNKCQATALAALLSFEGMNVELLDDLAKEATSAPFDPITQTFFVQSWLNATRNLLNGLVSSMSSSEMLDKILSDVQEWRVDNPDALYMCLSCIAMQIPDILGRYGNHLTYVREISNDIWEAYNSHVFDDPDVARLCLGFVAVCDLSAGSSERLHSIVKTLQASVAGYGGQPSFGAFFALGVIAQSCAANSEQQSDNVGLSLITEIVAFLVSQLIACISGSHEALGSLVKCIQRGKITPDVIESLTAMKKKSLRISSSKLKSAKSIFISFSVCLPAVTKVNDELLLGIYCLLESLAWGCGKGFCLPAVLHCCRETGLFEESEVEKMYQKYAKLFETGMENGNDGIDDIFYAVTAIQSKSVPYSIRKFMVGNRNLFDENGRALSLVSVVVSVSSIPCLGRGTASFLTCPRTTNNVKEGDVKGVVESVLEGTTSSEWNQYSQMATILEGFLASLRNHDQDRLKDVEPRILDSTVVGTSNEPLQLPMATPGTVLEVIVTALQEQFNDTQPSSGEEWKPVCVPLLRCLEVLSLPGQFADVMDYVLCHGGEAVKEACTRIIVSQIKGRPRAVFDGREFTNLALKISKMPMSSLRDYLGEGPAAEVFLEFFGDILSKFVSQSVEEAAEGIFRFCANAIGQNTNLIIKFLQSMKYLLGRASESKSFRFSPKAVSSIQILLLRKVFAGLRDASWTSDGDKEFRDRGNVLDSYADCLGAIPVSVFQENDFFSVKELDGFVGESLRVRLIMILVGKGYFESTLRAHGEISSTMAWICRQLIACNDEIFSCNILRVACTIAEASEKSAPDGRRELLVSLLDNLLLVSAKASYVGLEILAALTFQWCRGSGSDGDLSMLFAFGTSTARWQDLPSDTLKDVFQLAVHDLPFNLARYIRREKCCKVVCNRLWRIYVKWSEQGANDEIIRTLRQALITCRDGDVASTEDLVTLTTSMVLEP